MDSGSFKPIGALIKDRNIILKGADAATTKGFTQVPNFILRSVKLSPGDKLAFAMLLSYAWQDDYCFRVRSDLGKIWASTSGMCDAI